MAALNFPSDPADGDIYSPDSVSNNITYVWDSNLNAWLKNAPGDTINADNITEGTLNLDRINIDDLSDLLLTENTSIKKYVDAGDLNSIRFTETALRNKEGNFHYYYKNLII